MFHKYHFRIKVFGVFPISLFFRMIFVRWWCIFSPFLIGEGIIEEIDMKSRNMLFQTLQQGMYQQVFVHR